MDRSARSPLIALAFFLALVVGSSAFARDPDKPPILPDPPSSPTATEPAAKTPAPVEKAAATPDSAPAKKTVRPQASGASNVGRGSVLRLFTQANPMLWPLGLCSIVTIGYALERMVALRRERVIPRDFVNRFLERLASGKLDRDRATELCKANESPVARVFAQVVSYWGQPAATIRQAIGYDAAGEVSDLKRNVRVLNGTATLAPLLGLLGTVVGMIQSFDSLGGRVGSARGEALAHGISLALVTTAGGLVIAAISVAAYYYLLNRVDLLVRELDDNAKKVIDLVSSEAIRPSPVADRRPSFASPADRDHGRHESRTHRETI